ncbi:MAG: MATE family efflux transporter [bacterium]|nr:MATE family efflux transporter [bacterium]
MKDNLLERLQSGKPLSLKQLILMTVNLSIPAIMARMTSVAMQYIDASMVGSVGSEAAAAIGLVSSTTWLLTGITVAAGMGFTVQIAQRLGGGEGGKARSLVRHGLAAVLIFSLVLGGGGAAISGSLPLWLGGSEGIIRDASLYFLIFSAAIPLFAVNFTASSMIQASGNMKIPSVLNIMTCFLDVAFNAVMIFPQLQINMAGQQLVIKGAGMGVAGAAAGTLLAMAVSCLAMTGYLLFVSEDLKLRKDDRKYPIIPELKEPLRLAVPMAFEEFVIGSAYVAFTRIVSPLGTVALAANSFAITAEGLCYMPGYGIANAASALIGQSVGAGRPDLARRLGWVNAFLGMGIMMITGALMYAFAPEMIGLLSQDPEVIAAGTSILRIEAFAEPFFAAGIVIAGIFRGAGNTLLPSLVNFVSMWAVRIPAAALLASSYGIKGVWAAMCAELCIRGIMFAVFLIRGGRTMYMKKAA